ncbi:HK97 gp10 family phage protein [Petroclostridium sp. X23]|uniref:HK97 gp10 family phage protein n=1 Tax=Petroclostridium sp. X23 TaxID=3045146 RepID=UPI0024ADFC0C|nr:HK97 gp10 family phage protein [Petroclostridium sp. X23]WHH58307.1 HK97 gp10 family phage protein [Petroclostridium sp. X23]
MDIQSTGHKLFKQVEQQVKARVYRASNELRNASQFVLRGQRTGRRYRVPFTGGKRRKPRYYTASAPGEAPANRTGALRASWWQRPRAIKEGSKVTVYPAIASELKYGKILEDGTRDGRIAPRPFVDKIKEKAMPRIRSIYKAPYTLTP